MAIIEGKKKPGSGEKKEKDQNPQSNSSKQEESKTKGHADSKKLKTAKNSEKVDAETGEMADVERNFNETLKVYGKVRANLELYDAERREIFQTDSKGKYLVSETLRDHWSKLQKRAKGAAAVAEGISKLGSSIGDSISSGYATGQSLRGSGFR